MRPLMAGNRFTGKSGLESRLGPLLRVVERRGYCVAASTAQERRPVERSATAPAQMLIMYKIYNHTNGARNEADPSNS
jgi:hypothetical protein